MIQEVTTIFYVDDDPDDRSFFEEITNQLGEKTSLFELGDAMLLQLKNAPPHPSVVFLDLNMPIKDGFEVLHEIKTSTHFSHIPVIVLSTTNNPDTAKRCLDLGASLYITKSPSLLELKKSVEYVLAINWDHHTITPENFVYK